MAQSPYLLGVCLAQMRESDAKGQPALHCHYLDLCLNSWRAMIDLCQIQMNCQRHQ